MKPELGAVEQMAKAVGIPTDQLIERILLRWCAGLKAEERHLRRGEAPAPFHPELEADLAIDGAGFATLSGYEGARQTWELFGTEIYEAAGEHLDDFLKRLEELREQFNFETKGAAVVEAVRNAMLPAEQEQLNKYLDVALKNTKALKEMWVDALAILSLKNSGAAGRLLQRFEAMDPTSQVQAAIERLAQDRAKK